MTADEWLMRAARSLKTAGQILDEDPNSACNRAYYAMFYAARAAVMTAGHEERAMGKSHSGLIAAFGELVVKAGFVDAALGRLFAKVEHERLVADYTGDGVPNEVAAMAVSRADVFVQAIRGYVERHAA